MFYRYHFDSVYKNQKHKTDIMYFDFGIIVIKSWKG